MALHDLVTAVGDWRRNALIALGNALRRLRPAPVDYVLLTLSGELPEQIPPTPRWQRWLPADMRPGRAGPTLHGFRDALERIAGDPRPLGAVVHLDGLDIGWAKAQSIRDALRRFRKSGKKAVVYAPEYGTLNYFIATGADLIIAPPPGRWAVTGLRTEVTFLKDTLASIGIQAEVVNVSPYKAALDTLARSDISAEHRAMLTWLLDGVFEAVVEAIASARELDPGRVRELIDCAPLTAEAAREKGLLDAVLYEDDLAAYLAPPGRAPDAPRRRWPFGRRSRAPGATALDGERHGPPKPAARLRRWDQARAILRRPIRWRSGKYVGVISLEGTIIPGRSRQLPLPLPIPIVGAKMAGAETVAQHFREAERDGRIAAIVFYVDSRGGSATASDLIWREVDRVRRKKPVVVCMADIAASGGYYVAASGQWLVAQPLTTTGSIGVISFKPVTADLYGRFNARRVVLSRGARAGLYADDAPFTPEARAVVQAEVDDIYARFKSVVKDGRHLPEASLDEVAGGRVWLGQQALQHRLVDEIGDMHAAMEKARALAKLPADRWTPALWYFGPGGHQLPPPFAPSHLSQAADLLRALAGETMWLIDPFELTIS